MKGIFQLFFLLFFLSASSQEMQEDISYQDTPLIEILTALEDIYNLKFSFNSDVVSAINVTLGMKSPKLEKVLAAIEEQSKLIFEKVNSRYYIVKRNTKTRICGYLEDNRYATSIVGASIMNSSQNKGTQSDEKGYFILENVEISDTLFVSFLGYKTLSLAVDQFKHEQCDRYQLFIEDITLEEVVVQEYLASGSIKTRDGSVKFIPNTLETLSGVAEPDVLQNIQLLPGIESPSETASGLYIRGGTPDQNLILWDGIKMYNSDHFFGMLSAFNPYLVKEINIYRSGTQAQYGDRISGVIDIATDNDIPDQVTGGFGLNLLHTDGFLKVPVSEDVGLQFSARRAFTDIIKSFTFNRLSEKVFQNTSIQRNQEEYEPEYTDSNENFYFTDFTLKLIANLTKKDKVWISGLLTQNSLDYSFRDVEFNDSSSDKLSIQNLGANATWQRTWSPAFSTNTQLYYSEYDLSYSGTLNFDEDAFTTTKQNSIKEIGLRVHSDWAINKTFTFSNGYQFFANQVSYTLGENSFLDRDRSNSPTYTIYNQVNYRPKNWYLTLGLRTNYYTQLESLQIEPRLSLEYKLNNHLRINGSAEIKNQAISQIIEFTTLDFGIENQIWALAKQEEIPILSSNQWSIGVLWQKKGWKLDTELYYKKIDGLTSLTRGFETSDEDFEEGNSTTTGIDVLLKKKIGRYATWISYTNARTTYQFEDLNDGRSFTGNNNINHSLLWSHFYKWNAIELSLGWRIRTGSPYTEAIGISDDDDDETEIEYGTINAETLPNYHRLDASILYNFSLSSKKNPIRGRLGASIQNIYGRKNILSRSYTPFDITNDDDEVVATVSQSINKISLGITPNLIFRIEF